MKSTVAKLILFSYLVPSLETRCARHGRRRNKPVADQISNFQIGNGIYSPALPTIKMTQNAWDSSLFFTIDFNNGIQNLFDIICSNFENSDLEMLQEISGSRANLQERISFNRNLTNFIHNIKLFVGCAALRLNVSEAFLTHPPRLTLS